MQDRVLLVFADADGALCVIAKPHVKNQCDNIVFHFPSPVKIAYLLRAYGASFPSPFLNPFGGFGLDSS